jgi:hypothetical protein
VIVLLRFIGVMNAAVWLGAAIFFTFAAAPVLFTPETKRLVGEAQAGIVAQMVLERYFALQYWCGSVALIHQLAEWVYLGKSLQKVTFGILLGTFGLALIGGLWLQPKLQKLHQTKYGYVKNAQGYAKNDTSAAQRAQADRTFAAWHGLSMVINVFVLGGLAFFLWRVANPTDGPRFVPANKFRS